MVLLHDSPILHRPQHHASHHHLSVQKIGRDKSRPYKNGGFLPLFNIFVGANGCSPLPFEIKGGDGGGSRAGGDGWRCHEAPPCQKFFTLQILFI